MRVVDDGRWDELHRPAAGGHAVGELHVLRASHRETRVVTVHLKEPVTAKAGRIGVNEVDVRNDLP